MKIELFRQKLSGLLKPGTTAATAMVSGYWITQLLALYFVSGSICGIEPKVVGTLFSGLFGVLFISHFSRPWSRLAAVFGLASLGVFEGCMICLCAPISWLDVPSFGAIILLSLGLILAGILLEVEQYRRWIIETQHRRINFEDVIPALRHLAGARNFIKI